MSFVDDKSDGDPPPMLFRQVTGKVYRQDDDGQWVEIGDIDDVKLSVDRSVSAMSATVDRLKAQIRESRVDPLTLHMEGWDASLNGQPVSACPYEISDPRTLHWQRGWIRGTTALRDRNGTFGEPADRYVEEAERFSAELQPDPCQEVIDNLAEMSGEIEEEELLDFVSGLVDLVDLGKLAAAAAGLGTAFSGLASVAVSAAQAAQRFQDAFGALAAVSPSPPKFTLVLGPDVARRLGAAAKRLGLGPDVTIVDDVMAGAAQKAPPRTGKLRSSRRCPSHGEELVGGGCRRCQRERSRLHARRR